MSKHSKKVMMIRACSRLTVSKLHKGWVDVVGLGILIDRVGVAGKAIVLVMGWRGGAVN